MSAFSSARAPTANSSDLSYPSRAVKNNASEVHQNINAHVSVSASEA